MASRPERSGLDDISGFYDWLAPEYDRMTGFEARFDRERPILQDLVSRHGIRTAVDAGCGTGFLSLLLAQLGVKVIAADLSGEMLRRLEERARSGNLAISVLASSFADLGQKVSPPVDAVFCLGNSLPHLPREDDLQASVRGLASALRPGGLLVLQTLNFERILASRERVQSVKEAGGITYVRFYDFEERGIRFNILKLIKQAGGISHELRSVNLRPILRDRLLELLSEAGFEEARMSAGLAGEAFSLETSRDLVVFAMKGRKPC